MQLRKPLQYLQEYLDNNPDKREVYVNWGLVAAKLVVAPVNKLLRHLIEIQHLDPNGMPNFEIIKNALDIRHTKSYDEDFDAERLAKIYEKIHPTLPPQEEFPRFIDNSASDLDPLDDLQNLLDEDFKPISDAYNEAVIDNRDALSMEEIKKLIDRTEELKKIKDELTKCGIPSMGLPSRKTRRGKIVKQVAKSQRKRPNFNSSLPRTSRR